MGYPVLLEARKLRAQDEPGMLPLDPAENRTSESTDDDLIAAFHDVRDKLFRKLYAMLGNHADAQDALQLGFLHCWRARAGIRELRSLRGWVWRVGVNAGRDLQKYLRCRRTKPLHDAESEMLDDRRSAADILMEQEDQERLEAALEHLRPAEREVFRLRNEAALSYEEIARRCSCPVGTAKPLMHRAVNKLRRLLCDAN